MIFLTQKKTQEIGQDKPKTWLTRDLIDTTYARSLLLSSWRNDLTDLKQAISEMLILVCLESSVTQVKQKCLKALKILPLTNMITKLVLIRLND